MLGFVGVAIAIRLHGLAAANLWLDEANSWQVARRSWSTLIGELRGSPVGPLYFVLLKPWISAFGDSVFALRAFSVLASIALIPAVYALGAKLLSRRAGLIAALLTALSPLELYFAQEARMYMLTSLVALLAFWSYVEWRERALALPDMTGSPRWALLWYTIAGITLLFTHPVAGTLLVAVNLDALVLWWQSRARTNRWTVISWVAAQLAILGIVVVYLAFVSIGTAASSQAWRSALGFERSLRAALLFPFAAVAGQHYYASDFWFAYNDLLQRTGSMGRFTTLLIVQPLTLLVFVVAGDATIRARSKARQTPVATPSVQGARRLLLFALVVPLAFAVLISISRALETERYFLFVVPFLFLLLADGLAALHRQTRFLALAVLVAAMLLGTRTTQAAVSRDSDYRPTAALILHDLRPGDRVMIQPREMNAPLRYYLGSPDFPVIGLAADASAGRELAKLSPGRTWVVIDYRSPLYTLAPEELQDSLHAVVLQDEYTSDASAGVRVALVDTRKAPKQ
ncbi:MAG TPA: glycosyltransferase family 39 protein [Gemmatimonadaceae bacterium]|nr:glycosyltransferase family 39 protein [Gemmatimonadaceae bacterium]